MAGTSYQYDLAEHHYMWDCLNNMQGPVQNEIAEAFAQNWGLNCVLYSMMSLNLPQFFCFALFLIC
jgi:hypothetical protein